MKTTRFNFNKHLRMHLATEKKCSFRPAMENIYFKDGFMFATNSYFMIKCKVSEVSTFGEDEINLLDGKFIHHTDYRDLLKEEFVTIDEKGFIAIKCNRETRYNFNEKDLKFPNTEELWPKEYGELKDVGLNANLLDVIAKIITEDGKVSLHFTTQSSPIIVRPVNGNSMSSSAIIMPVLINQ